MPGSVTIVLLRGNTVAMRDFSFPWPSLARGWSPRIVTVGFIARFHLAPLRTAETTSGARFHRAGHVENVPRDHTDRETQLLRCCAGESKQRQSLECRRAPRGLSFCRLAATMETNPKKGAAT